MNTPACKTCRFWEPCQLSDRTGNDETLASQDGGNSGECRIRAPLRILADAPDALTLRARTINGEITDYEEGMQWEGIRRVFPMTYSWDWCGEWEEAKG